MQLAIDLSFVVFVLRWIAYSFLSMEKEGGGEFLLAYFSQRLWLFTFCFDYAFVGRFGNLIADFLVRNAETYADIV